MNPKQECKKLINSFRYAIEGFISSFKTERNMKIHVLATIIVIIAGININLSPIEWCLLAITISLVLMAELFNTAIETIVDMISPEKNEKAKLAKDISAAAVLVLAIGAVAVGTIIFMSAALVLNLLNLCQNN